MRKNEVMGKFLAAALAASMAVSPAMAFAATTNGALDGTDATDNPTSVVGDLNDLDIQNKADHGSLTIHKYDLTSAQNELTFNWSDTDHDSDGTDSTLTTSKPQNGQAGADSKTFTITSNGKQNDEAEKALAPYAIKGVEFTYLRVGDVKTLSDINEDGTNGDIELIYGVDTDLMAILGLKAYDNAKKGTDGVAVTQVEGINYFTAEQIRVALKNVLNVGTYNGADKTKGDASYATGEDVGTAGQSGSTTNEGNRLDGKKGVTAVDRLEDYIQNDGDAHVAGKKMDLTDKDGMTTKDNLDLGLYLLVETKVPENVTETVNPWFVQLPMTDIEGDQWFYNVSCYPKNQSGHPTLDKKVRNEYGTAGLNYDSAGANNTSGDVKINKQDSLAKGAPGIVTNDDGKKGDKLDEWLTEGKKAADYQWNTTTTASEGDRLGFMLKSKLPNITSKATRLKRFEYIDTLSKGLVYNGDAKIAIYRDETAAEVNDTTKAIDVWTTSGADNNYMFEAKEATAKPSDDGTVKGNGAQQLDITVQTKGLEEIAEKYYDGQHYLVVYYTATLASNADTVLGDNGNPNDVSLVWGRSSEKYYNVLEDRSIVYSYGIDLTKLFSDNNTKEADFKAVQFVLYNATEDYYVTAEKGNNTDGLYYVTGKEKDKAKATKFSPDGTGKLLINGIEGDDYKLTEIHTAKGYTLGQNQVRITINQASRTITPSAVYTMTVADDHDEEHIRDEVTKLQLSNGTTEDTFNEGTTDKQRIVIGDLVSTTATIDGAQAAMGNYGAETALDAKAVSALKDTTAKNSTNAELKMSITNHKGFSLPKTGGKGVYFLTIVGVVGAVIGFYIISEDKKKKAKAN